MQGHPDPLEGTIDAPIGRHPKADYKFAVMADGRHSVTHYETLEAHRFASLLEVHLETGRTHQIRVHMAALKHPCVGDLTYGADPVLAKRVGLERQWLHAVRLGFEHPDTGEYVEYESTYPDDLAARAGGRSAMPTDRARCCARRRPTDAAGDRRPLRRGRAAAPARDAAGRPHRRRGPRRGSRRLGPRRARGLGRRGATARWSATPGSTGDWLDDLFVAPGRAGQRRRRARCSTWSRRLRPDGFCLWVFEMQHAGPRASTRGTAWSSSSAPTARATRRRRPTSGWPGRAPTRWPSSAA